MNHSASARLFLILSAVTWLFGGAVSLLCWNSYMAAQDKLSSVRKEIKDPTTMRKELENSKAKLADLKVQLAHLEVGIPDAAYMPTMLKELESIGKQDGLEVLGVRPIIEPVPAKKDAKAPKKPYDQLTIEVKGRGTYAGVLKFVQSLDKFPKIVAARMVVLTPKTDPLHRTGTQILDATITIRAYMFKQAKPVSDSSQVALGRGAQHEG